MSFFDRLFGSEPKPVTNEPAQEPKQEAPEVQAVGLIIQADRPIERIADDQFDRAAFATQIAKVIATRQDPSSLVVGLYGPWGDGKTSVLGMIREALQDQPAVIPMDYNPWFYGSSTEAITRSFFKSLSETLEKSKLFTKENLGQLMATLGKAVPQVGEAVAAVGETMATEELASTRDKVGEVLRRHGKKVVVFVDDIDRLDRSDIQTLFKLVRLSGGFDHTTYVLAFDDNVVSEALGEAYGSGDPVAGRRFLEKIVQVPLHLPPANPEKLRKLMFSACDRVIAENRLELVEGEGTELGNGLVTGFSGALRTPRQVKLFDNAITFAVPLLTGEVRLVDQILIEGLRIFYPSVYQAVRHNPDSVLKTPERQQGQQPPPQSPVKRAVAALDVDEPEKKAIEDLLEALFPRLSRMTYGDSWDQTWGSKKRICSSDYFSRYFTYAVPTGDMSDQSVELLVTQAVEGNDKAVSSIVDAAFAREAVPLLIRKLRFQETTLQVAAARLISLTLAARSSRIPTTQDLFLGDFTFTQGAILVSRLASRLDKEAQDALLREVAEQADTLTFVTDVLRFARLRPQERGEDRGYLEPERAHPLAAIIFERLRGLAEESNLFEACGDRLARVVYAIETAADDRTKGELRDYLSEVMVATPGNAVRFLKAFAGRSQGGSGAIGVGDFSRDAYIGLSDLLDPNALYALLREQFGEELDSAQWRQDWDGAQDVDRRVADQFSYLHRNPTQTESNRDTEQLADVDIRG